MTGPPGVAGPPESPGVPPPAPAPAPPPRPSRWRFARSLGTGAWRVLALLLLVVVVLAGARVLRWGRAMWRPAEPTITHDLVVQQLQDVAKLVSTEMTLRDVVVFDQSRLIFRKRALIVVTGKVLAGVDLKRGTDVRIDHRAKLITIVL
ncbi:MAG TPA: DUF4230 domain-containing protein, partial [Gemmatimonadales bacterium]